MAKVTSNDILDQFTKAAERAAQAKVRDQVKALKKEITELKRENRKLEKEKEKLLNENWKFCEELGSWDDVKDDLRTLLNNLNDKLKQRGE